MIHSEFYNKLVRDDMLSYFCKNAIRTDSIHQYLGNAFTWVNTEHPDYWTNIGSDKKHVLNEYDLDIIEANNPELFI